MRHDQDLKEERREKLTTNNKYILSVNEAPYQDKLTTIVHFKGYHCFVI